MAAASAAAETARPVLLLSAPDAAAGVGCGWFKALLEAVSDANPGAQLAYLFDCGAMPGQALAALRHGLTAIRYDGPASDAILDIARQLSATVERDRPEALDLVDIADDDPELAEICRRWLADGL